MILRQGSELKSAPGQTRSCGNTGGGIFSYARGTNFIHRMPVIDDRDIRGVGVFNASVDETRRIMDEDPGVQAGIFVYETHLCRGFPGDSLAQ
jgi:hypothetical protein